MSQEFDLRTSIRVAADSAYQALSRKRGYPVEPGACVCVFIACLMAEYLQKEGVLAEVREHELENGSSNWALKVGKDRMHVDATWFSMLTPVLQQGSPWLLIIDQGKAEGIGGEPISDEALHYYLSQHKSIE